MIEDRTTLLDENNIRVDGRKLKEMRPLEMEVGVLKRADGSAVVKHGGNHIVCAVYGPREIHPKHLALPDQVRIRAEYRLATFSVGSRKSPAPKRRERELSKIISEALEPSIFVKKFPGAVIDIYINVIDADGGTRCASITAASLALADAGIPLKGLVPSVAAGKVGGKVVLDLCAEEDKEGQGDLPIAMLANTKEITLCQLDGDFTPEEVKEGIEMAMEGCELVYEKQREALIEKYESIRREVKGTEPDEEEDEEEFDIEDEEIDIEDDEDEDEEIDIEEDIELEDEDLDLDIDEDEDEDLDLDIEDDDEDIDLDIDIEDEDEDEDIDLDIDIEDEDEDEDIEINVETEETNEFNSEKQSVEKADSVEVEIIEETIDEDMNTTESEDEVQ